jgi:hypothetical protein
MDRTFVMDTPEKSGSAESPRCVTAGRILRDGAILELLRDPGPPFRIKLLCWDKRVLQTGPQILHSGQSYELPDVETSIARALRLPTGVAPAEAAGKLFDDVAELFRERLGQLENCAKLLTSGIFASWFSPVLSMAPIIWILVPPGSPKHQLLQLLGTLCRRPLRLVGLTRGDLRSLPLSIQPTLLLDEPDVRPAVLSILSASAHRGSYIRGGASWTCLGRNSYARSISPTMQRLGPTRSAFP